MGVNRFSRGIVTDRNRLYWEDFKRLTSLIPPKLTQDAIVRRRCSGDGRSNEQAIIKASREVDLVREYRTRLIADVVTGKLDVRGVARHL